MALAPETLVIAAVVVPFIGAALIPVFSKAPNPREAVTLLTAAALCFCTFSLIGPVLSGAQPSFDVIQVAPGLDLAFKVEPLGLLFALVASSLWVVNSVYSIGYMRGNNEPRQTSFYFYFAIALGSTIGIAFAANLFTLFLFYEALTLSTFPLVAHKQDAKALRGARIYLAMLLGSSLLLFLPAIVITGYTAGTLDFTPGGVLAGKADLFVVTALTILYLFGIGKAAVMPGHFWLPEAMVAPTPVSALLHAVAVVKAGVFTVVKVAVYILGIDLLAAAGQAQWLTIAAGFTIVAASLVALRQDNLKKRLAYSTVSQLSYIVLGVAILTPISVVGAAMYIAAHAFSKITLFFAAGSLHTAAHLDNISQLDGVGRRMPWTMGAFAVGALGMIGVPPAVTFIGKFLMIGGAVQSLNWIAVAVIAVSTVLNACYFLPIVYRAFFREPPADHPHGEAPLPMVIAVTVTAFGTVALFVFSALPFDLATLMVMR